MIIPKLKSGSMLITAIMLTCSCSKSTNTGSDNVSHGSADFSTYIAVGNSLTSGFADDGLTLEGQKNAYPELIAGQLKAAGGGAFSGPYFNNNQANGTGFLSLTGFEQDGTPKITRVPAAANRPEGNGLLTKYSGPLNNFGVPGIKLADVNLASYGNLNPFFERMLPGVPPNNNTSYMDFVMAKPFTFFTMWLGNNDILAFATRGGADPNNQPTDKTLFNTFYSQVINTLTRNNAKGAVATIPDVLTTPLFNAVTRATLLAKIQQSAPNVRDIYIRTGGNVTRPATDEDYFLLTLASAGVIGVPDNSGLPYGLHPNNPIESKWVLDKDEAQIVKDYTDNYNNSIKTVAATKGLAIFDANALLKTFTGNGRVVDGVTITSAYIRGNLFSLDGIHLTPKGYAIVANGFVQAINEKYGSTLKLIDTKNFRGVKMP